MRVSALLLLFAISFPAGAAGPLASPSDKAASPAANCLQTTSHLAGKSGVYSGAPLMPRKLTELPRGTTYMAVYRQIGGCEAPLTLVDYRNSRRR